MTIGIFTFSNGDQVAIDMSTVTRVVTNSGLATIWIDEGLYFTVQEPFDEIVSLWRSVEGY